MKINAKNEKEALKIAKKKLGKLDYSDDNFIIQTLIPPQRGLFGLIKKGVYEVSLVGQSSDLTTYVAIKDGQIEVCNPTEDENFPILYVNDDNITLTVNDEVIKSKVALKENDNISITLHHIEPISDLSLEISRDKMEATLNIVRENGKKFYLLDMEKTARGHLRVGSEDIPPKEISLQQCLDLLHNENILEEFIDLDSIQALLSEEGSTSGVVARGIPVQEGSDAKVIYSPNLIQEVKPNAIEPIVDEGEILAEKQDPIPGTEGTNLLGEKVKPKPVKDIDLQAGEGAKLVENGKKIVSAIKGRPYLKHGIITVVPILTINGDLSMEMGPINFEGSVIIKGNVLDESKIYATRTIEIMGSAYNSEITSHGSIHINEKAIGCKIQAGIDTCKLYLTKPYFEDINKKITDFFRKLKADDFNTSQDKMNLIYSFKESLEESIKELEKLFSVMQEDEKEQIEEFIKSLRNSLLQLTLSEENGIKMLLSDYKDAKNLIEQTSSSFEENIILTLDYAQGCELNSCGSVIIKGKGTYQTNIVAQDDIIYKNPASVVRGGTLIAGTSISAGTIGSKGEIYTECRVLSENGPVKGHFHSGTVVYINNVKQDILTI